MKHTRLLLIGILISTVACSSDDDKDHHQLRKENQKGEYLYRHHDDKFYAVAPSPERAQREYYPWEQETVGNYPRITKEFFRCKGSSLNTVKIIPNKTETVRYYDCGGSERHSLPLKEGKEFIYPILIDLVNTIQVKTGKRVVITCGHRCPDHNIYADPSPKNQFSKHLIGAEVAFYVQGLENNPDRIVKIIQEYYQSNAKYKGLKDYQEFKRYEKDDVDVSTQPWYNKEVFIKLYKKNEGRDFDNRHPYPYISIQVRYDWDKQEKVTYSWDKAFNNYHRY